MVVMTLCPNCRSIQKAGTVCALCNCPVEPPPSPPQPEHRAPGAGVELRIPPILKTVSPGTPSVEPLGPEYVG